MSIASSDGCVEQGSYSVAVIIPAFNEEGAIGQTLRSIRKLLPSAQLVVCDNRSTDKTSSEASCSGALVLQEKKRGKGNAVRKLLTSVNADIYILVDGDNTYDLSYLPSALKTFVQERMDLMTGNRRGHGSSFMRLGHAFGNQLFTFALRSFLDVQTSDVFSGFRIMSRRLIRSFPLVSTEFEIETELSIFASRMKLSQCDFPTKVKERVGTQSKLDTFSDGFKILFFVLRSVHREYPMKIYLPLGFLGLVVGIAHWISLYFEFLETGLVLRFPTLIVACFVVLTSLLLLITGILLREMSTIKYQARYLAYIRNGD